MSAPTLARVQEHVAEHLQQITDLFKPGVRVTLLVRTPGQPERDFMMTDDVPAELVKMIERRVKAVAP